MHGATPPHVYDLDPARGAVPRRQALRLIPVGGEGAIFGRTGLLTHTYLLGPRGDSNGCISFKDYDAFLRAYKTGKVKRMVVVASIDDPQLDLRMWNGGLRETVRTADRVHQDAAGGRPLSVGLQLIPRLADQLIRALVELIARVALHPVPVDRVSGARGIEPLPQILVLHRLFRRPCASRCASSC